MFFLRFVQHTYFTKDDLTALNNLKKYLVLLLAYYQYSFILTLKNNHLGKTSYSECVD